MSSLERTLEASSIAQGPVLIATSQSAARRVLRGQVANMMTGKERTFTYQSEKPVGEATRVSVGERRGVAGAHGSRGLFARCEYQMNGAHYQVHIGS